MVKRFLFLSTLIILPLIASDIMTPPPFPALNLTSKHKEGKEKKDNTKQDRDSCKIIPPMLMHLPPMLEDDLDRCKSSLYVPSAKSSKKSLSKMLKRSVEIKSIEAIEGFSMLYKIESNAGIFVCNRKVDRCIDFSMKILTTK